MPKFSDIVEVERHKEYHTFSKPTYYWQAKLKCYGGPQGPRAESKQDAIDLLLDNLKGWFEHAGEHVYFLANDGQTVFHLYHTGLSWAYAIVGPNHAEVEPMKGTDARYIRSSVAYIDAKGKSDAWDKMRRHAGDYRTWHSAYDFRVADGAEVPHVVAFHVESYEAVATFYKLPGETDLEPATDRAIAFLYSL